LLQDKFADWMPKQIEQHWQRKRFRDFEYLDVEISSTQLTWILIIIGLYNICISIWVVINEFTNDGDGFTGNKKPFGYRNFFK